MARTPESKVKARIVRLLKKYGAYYFFPQTGGYGSSGIPDIIICYYGLFIAIECKAGNNKPTALQKLQLEKIVAAEGIATVVNEKNIGDVEELLITIRTLFG